MKNSLLFLLIFVSATSFASLPTIQVLDRVQTAPGADQPKLIVEKDGSITLVQIESMPNDLTQDLLRAYDKDGKITGEIKLPAKTNGSYLSILRADRTETGELVALFHFNRPTGEITDLRSVNLTTGKITTLASGLLPAFMDRIRFNGKNLALIGLTVPAGKNVDNPTRIRLVDEDTGVSVAQTNVSYGVDGKLGLNSQGQLRALLFGYELFGLVDLNSGKYQDLLPVREHSSDYPEFLQLSIGDVFRMNDNNTSQLFAIKDLFEGKTTPIRTFGATVNFVGGQPAHYAVELSTDNVLQISDLGTGKPLGAPIKRPKMTAINTTVQDIQPMGTDAVAVINEIMNPDGISEGTVLTYLMVGTGQILRKFGNQQAHLDAQIFLQNGHPMALEIATANAADSYQLVDLTQNQVTAGAPASFLSTKALQTPSGAIVGLTSNPQRQVCFSDLTDVQQTACISDPRVTSDSISGFSNLPLDPATNKFTLQLLGAPQTSSQSFGYMQITVN